MNNNPIGFVDSGVGGLSVVKQMFNQLPNETVYFIGDNKRCPYGDRPIEQVKQYTWEMVQFLLDKNIKMLVVACNTATAAVLDELKEQLSIPVVGVIAPGAREAILHSKKNRIGVIGTRGTIQSNVYEKTIHAKKDHVKVFNLACPNFVPIVETNQIHTDAAKQIIQEDLMPMLNNQVDTLILGCTHYPLLREHIQEAMGENVKLIDSGAQTVHDVSVILDYLDLANTQPTREHRFFTTGDYKPFRQIAMEWLELDDVYVETVSLKKVENKMKTILIATKNVGKAKEFETIFKQYGYTIQTLLDYPDIPDVLETGVTFEENARLKAETISELLNIPVIADDSGLQVVALDGQPGVYSARYAGENKNDAANNAKLLAELSQIPNADRSAKFHCTLVLKKPNESSHIFTGELEGEIGMVPQGENGFGYDPLFYIPDLQKTSAQLEPSEKNKISHRAKAIQKLIQALPELEL